MFKTMIELYFYGYLNGVTWRGDMFPPFQNPFTLTGICNKWNTVDRIIELK